MFDYMSAIAIKSERFKLSTLKILLLCCKPPHGRKICHFNFVLLIKYLIYLFQIFDQAPQNFRRIVTMRKKRNCNSFDNESLIEIKFHWFSITGEDFRSQNKLFLNLMDRKLFPYKQLKKKYFPKYISPNTSTFQRTSNSCSNV